MTFPSRLDKSGLPPTLSFLNQHFDRVPRPSRNRVMVRCNLPGHDDRTPSMSWDLSTGKFHCFGCGSHGDMLDYMTLRYSMSFQQAAHTLGVWKPLTTSTYEWQRQRARLQAERERLRAEQIAQKEQERRERIEARDWLHLVEKLYDSAIANHHWELMELLLAEVREADERYCRLAGLEVSHGW